jgi:hypothetical protein
VEPFIVPEFWLKFEAALVTTVGAGVLLLAAPVTTIGAGREADATTPEIIMLRSSLQREAKFRQYAS